jgi:ribose-phosphate pyrophosphokinase
MKIITGNSNPGLVRDIVRYLKRQPELAAEEVTLIPAQVGHFGNGEVSVYLGPGDESDVRNQEVYIVQSTCAPASNILELLLMVDAAARASAGQITVVFPFFAYAYQDRKSKPRVPISAKVMAQICAPPNKVNRVVCFDLHSAQVQALFDVVRSEHVFVRRVLVDYLAGRIRRLKRKFVLVAPDLGSSNVSRSYARRLGVPLAVIDKKHDPITEEVKAIHVMGASVRGKIACVIDDSSRTGRTVDEAVRALVHAGAAEVWAYLVHADFAPEGPRVLANCRHLTEIGVTDTIPLRPRHKKILGNKLRIISAADHIGETILRVHLGKSLSFMFD